MQVSTFVGVFASPQSALACKYSGTWWPLDGHVHWQMDVAAPTGESIYFCGKFLPRGESVEAALADAVNLFLTAKERAGVLSLNRLVPRLHESHHG